MIANGLTENCDSLTIYLLCSSTCWITVNLKIQILWRSRVLMSQCFLHSFQSPWYWTCIVTTSITSPAPWLLSRRPACQNLLSWTFLRCSHCTFTPHCQMWEMTNATDYMFPPFRGELRRVRLLTGFKI